MESEHLVNMTRNSAIRGRIHSLRERLAAVKSRIAFMEGFTSADNAEQSAPPGGEVKAGKREGADRLLRPDPPRLEELAKYVS